MDKFYRDVIGLATETDELPVLEKKKAMLVMWPLSPMGRFRCIWRPKI